MTESGSQHNSWRSRLLWLSIVLVAAMAFGLSVVEILALSNSLPRITVIAVSLFVAILVSRYQPQIPGTRLTFSPKDIFAFWGVIWIGVSGGIILGAFASLAQHGLSRKDKRRLASNVAVDTLAIFISSIAFYLTLGYIETDRQLVAGGLAIPYETLIASCVMALTHVSQRSALHYLIGPGLDGLAITSVRRLLLAPAAVTAISLVTTLFLYVVFNHFGIEFGLVFIPISIAGHLSHRIHVRRLEHKTRLIMESSRIHLATVEALATAIDARDQMGMGHVRRTQIFAVGIGDILGLGEDEINAIRTGALLHDIGKLAVPDHILNKPGRLTPAEMEKIKTHALVGASILEKVGFPYAVVPTVKYHHEFFDGTGYPEGLRGSSIPLTARILSIADTYDTLRVARPYRNAVPREEACNFLRSRAGSQFDPRLVDVFLRNLRIFENEIEAQQLGYRDDLDAVGVAEVTDSGVSPNYVEQIKQANREVFTLYSLAREFSSELDLDEIMSLFTEKVRDLVPFDTSVVYLLDDTHEFARAAYVEGKNKATLTAKVIRVGEGATGEVLRTSKPTENNEPNLDLDLIAAPIAGLYGAMASIPLIAEDTLVGAITLYSSQVPRYQEEHLRLLETVSRIAADAIAKSLQHAVTENYALTDPMTGLPNARSLQMHFDKEVKRASRKEGSFQVLVLDLDGFKSVNDTHGHKVGDRMLKEIGSVIKDQLREYDFLARYGGDEFIAIVADTDSTDVLELVRRIEDAVQGFSLDVSEGTRTQVGVSIGTACYPIHGETFDQIITSADKAMYLTKSFHRKRAEELRSLHPAEDVLAPEMAVITQMPEEIMEFATVKGVSKDGLILEVDERHIVLSSAVN